MAPNNTKVKEVMKRAGDYEAGSDFEFWLSARFERVSAQEECDGETKIESLRCLVPQRLFYKIDELLTADPAMTYANLRAALVQFASDRPSPQLALQTLRSRKQLPHENFVSYVEELVRLAKLGYPGDLTLAEREVAMQVRNGTANARLREDLRYENPETVTEVLRLFKKRQAADLCRSDSVAEEFAAVQVASSGQTGLERRVDELEKLLKQVLANQEAQAQAQAQASRNVPMCDKCGKRGHLTRDCYSGQRLRQNDNSPRWNNDRKPRDTPSRGASSRNDECYECGGRGHFARDCPNRGRGSSSGNSGRNASNNNNNRSSSSGNGNGNNTGVFGKRE